MRDRRKALASKAWGALAMMFSLVGAVPGQAQRPAGRGQLRNQGGVPLKKARPEAGDPLAKAAGAVQRPASGLTHYTFRLRSFDGTPLATSYYPSRLGSSAPVVML